MVAALTTEGDGPKSVAALDDGKGTEARSVLWYLALLCAAILIPAIGFGTLVVYRYAASEQARLQAEAVGRAKELALAVDRDVSHVSAVLRTLATGAIVQSGDLAARNTRLRSARDALGFDMVLSDPTGQQVVNTRLPPGTALPMGNNPDMIAAVVRDGKPVVSDVFTGAVAKTPLYAVAVPVIVDGQVAYVLSASMSIDRMRDIILAEVLPEGWTGTVTDGKGIILARRPGHEERAGKPGSPAYFREATGAEGIWRGRNIAGVDVVVPYFRSEISDWTMAVGIPAPLMAAPVDRVVWPLAGLALSLLVISALLVGFYGRRLTGALNALADLAIDISAPSTMPFVTPVREINEAGHRITGLCADLYTSEARLRTALRVARAGVWQRDLATDEAYWSPEMFALFGWPLGRAPSFEKFLDAVHPDDRQPTAERFANALRDGRVDLEFRVIRPDGEIAWITSEGHVERDDKGRATLARGLDQDITERKRAELALARSEAGLRHALAAGRAYVYEWDMVNDQITRAGSEAVVGAISAPNMHGYMARVHPDDRARLDAAVGAASPERPAWSEEYRFIAADGRLLWVRESAEAEFDATGRPVRHIGIISDITTDKSVEADLSRNREFFRLAATAARVGTFELDLVTQGVKWSDELKRLNGFAIEAPVTIEQARAAVHPDDRVAVELAVAAALDPAGDGGFDITHRVIRLDGAVRWFLVRGSTSFAAIDGQRRAVTLAGVVLDITEAREAEETRKLLTAELSHRVKNSLATIQAIATHTSRGIGSVEGFLEVFNGRLQAMARAHDLLTQANWRGADIASIVRDQLDFGGVASGRIDAAGPLLELPPQPALQLGLVLHELGTNARKYGALSNAEGRVSVAWRIEPEDDKVLIVDWNETGGPKVKKPKQRGFGSTLVERSFGYGPNAAKIEFDPKGVRCTLRVILEGTARRDAAE